MHAFRHKRVWLVGDSITNLFWRGLNCEFWRFGMRYQNDEAMQQLFDDIPKRQWESGPPYQVFKYDAANMTLVFKGWHKVFRSEWELMFGLGDVFIVNYGLHYQNLTEYTDDLRWLFTECDRRWPAVSCVFRETSAQHFVNGAYSPDGKNGKVCGTADTNSLYAADNIVWRQNLIAAELLQSHAHVRLLPFYNLTAVRSDMLEERFCQVEARRDNPKAECLDCTHVTMSPVLFARIVNDLYILQD